MSEISDGGLLRAGADISEYLHRLLGEIIRLDARIAAKKELHAQIGEMLGEAPHEPQQD